MREGGREGEACYFTAVWKIWLTRGCPTLQETASPGEMGKTNKGKGMKGVVDGEWCGGFCRGSSHISAFTERIISLHEICLLAEHIKTNAMLR